MLPLKSLPIPPPATPATVSVTVPEESELLTFRSPELSNPTQRPTRPQPVRFALTTCTLVKVAVDVTESPTTTPILRRPLITAEDRVRFLIVAPSIEAKRPTPSCVFW